MSIKIKAVLPMFNGVITTMDKYEDTGGLVLDAKVIQGAVKEYLTVIAVGDSCKGGLKVGDLVKINPRRYMVVEQKSLGAIDGVENHKATPKYKWETIEINGRLFLKLFDNDIDLIITDWEEEESPIIKQLSLLIPSSNITF